MKYNNPDIDLITLPRKISQQDFGVFNVGTNDANYQVGVLGKNDDGENVLIWECPIYKTWKQMLRRCYTNIGKPEHRATVCFEWLKFSNFRKWYLEMNPPAGFELDKDILIRGCKHYSPATCAFIPNWLNLTLRSTSKPTPERMQEAIKLYSEQTQPNVDIRVIHALQEWHVQAMITQQLKGKKKNKAR